MDVMGLADQPGAYADASMDTHEDLIARARRGDEEAFRLIFERYTRPVISFIFYMVNDGALAEELAQETFVRAYKSLNALRDETKLSTWLFGIALSGVAVLDDMILVSYVRQLRQKGLPLTETWDASINRARAIRNGSPARSARRRPRV